MFPDNTSSLHRARASRGSILCPAYPRYPDNTSESTSTLSLSQVPTEVSLISESLTLDSLSSNASSSVPSFSALGSIAPIFTIVRLDERMPMSSFKEKCFDKSSRVILSSPTFPRRNRMLKEKLCVNRWVQNLDHIAAPGHKPWRECMVSSPTWKPEGSLYAPEEFSKFLRRARKPSHAIKPQSLPLLSSPSLSGPSKAHYEALNSLPPPPVFSPRTPGRSPVSDEHKTASSRARGKTTNSDSVTNRELAIKRGNYKDKSRLPSLQVSTSYYTIALSLDPSESMAFEDNETLATRRGQKTPLPLAVHKILPDSPYPSIPTAFLGSPSTYSPPLETSYLERDSDLSLTLADMICELRSQCISMAPHSPSLKCDGSAYAEASLLCSDMDNFDSEWVFTSPNRKKPTGKFFPKGFSDSTPRKGNTGFVVPKASSYPVNNSREHRRHSETIVPLQDITDTDRKTRNRATTISVPKRTPLPLRPALVSPSSASLRKRSSPKSVRFASLPARVFISGANLDNQDENLAFNNFQRRTIIRQISSVFGAISDEHSESPVSDSAAPKETTSSAENIQHKPTPSRALRRAYVTSPLRISTLPNNQTHKNASQLETPSPLKSKATFSFSRVMKLSSGGKENGRRKSKLPRASGILPLNEMTNNRSSVDGLEKSRSRMPVPLRNIFTHFK